MISKLHLLVNLMAFGAKRLIRTGAQSAYIGSLSNVPTDALELAATRTVMLSGSCWISRRPQNLLFGGQSSRIGGKLQLLERGHLVREIDDGSLLQRDSAVVSLLDRQFAGFTASPLHT